jgi:hypothetical protein
MVKLEQKANERRASCGFWQTIGAVLRVSVLRLAVMEARSSYSQMRADSFRG